jgi:50S ribosomal subunit-associated GTPase HflX
MVESFKTTLEEVAHADLVIHLRDISSPHFELQKKSVINILQELKFKDSFAADSMIEVWNKVDLVPRNQRQELLG